MIEPVASQTSATVAPGLPLRMGADDEFKAALASRASVQWQSPIAQHLLGAGADDAEDRQKSLRRGERAAVSISDLSSMAIADLGAPRLSNRAEAAGPAADDAPTRQPRRPEVHQAAGRERHQGHAQPQNTPREVATTRNPESQPEQPERIQAQSRAVAPVHAPEVRGNTNSTPALPRPAAQPVPPAATALQSGRDQNSGNANQRQDPGGTARTLASAQRTFGQSAPAPGAQAANRGFAAHLEQETKFAAQLSRGLASALRQGGGAVTMRLQPEALGHLTIRMDLHPGRVGASFEVQNDQARQLLDQNMPLLRSALEARGMDVERLDVRVAEPAERGGQAHNSDAKGGEREHHTGGAGTDEKESKEGRWEAPSKSADGGAAGNRQSDLTDDQEPEQDASAESLSMLRMWMQQVEMGGAQVMQIRLDAIA